MKSQLERYSCMCSVNVQQRRITEKKRQTRSGYSGEAEENQELLRSYKLREVCLIIKCYKTAISFGDW